MNALFANADPFSKEWNEYTELATNETINPSVSFENISELKEMFDECDPEYQKSLLLTLAKLPKSIKKIEDVPLSMFERIKQAVKSKRDEYRATNQDIFAVA